MLYKANPNYVPQRCSRATPPAHLLAGLGKFGSVLVRSSGLLFLFLLRKKNPYLHRLLVLSSKQTQSLGVLCCSLYRACLTLGIALGLVRVLFSYVILYLVVGLGLLNMQLHPLVSYIHLLAPSPPLALCLWWLVGFG